MPTLLHHLNFPALLLVSCLLVSLARACTLHRLVQGPKEWFLCTSCKSKARCCRRLSPHNNNNNNNNNQSSCLDWIASVPTTAESDMFSIYLTRSDSLQKEAYHLDLPNQVVWDTWNSTAFEISRLQSPFRRPRSARIHRIMESSISERGGMHRKWITTLDRLEPPHSVNLLLHLTHQVFVDMEDLVDQIQGGTLLNAQSASLVDIELPSMRSRQHVIVLELEPTAPQLQVSINLHLRYQEPCDVATTTTIQLPPPVLMNQQGRMGPPLLLEHVATGYEADAQWAWIVTLGCSLLAAALVLYDVWSVTTWT